MEEHTPDIIVVLTKPITPLPDRLPLKWRNSTDDDSQRLPSGMRIDRGEHPLNMH
jgi:hypothetical protein